MLDVEVPDPIELVTDRDEVDESEIVVARLVEDVNEIDPELEAELELDELDKELNDELDDELDDELVVDVLDASKLSGKELVNEELDTVKRDVELLELVGGELDECNDDVIEPVDVKMNEEMLVGENELEREELGVKRLVDKLVAEDRSDGLERPASNRVV